MSAQHTVVAPNQPQAIKRLKTACALVLAVVDAYWAAAAAGVSNGALSTVFTLMVGVLAARRGRGRGRPAAATSPPRRRARRAPAPPA